MASPRKTCVPGVHAHATLGTRTSNAAAAQSGPPRTRSLQPKLVAPPPNRVAQILELVLDQVVDRVLRGVDVVAHALLDGVARDSFPGVRSEEHTSELQSLRHLV